MKFINEGKPTQVRESDGPRRYKWKLLKTGETMDLPKKVGLRYGFKKMKATEGNIGDVKVETKQINTDKTTDKNTDDYSKKLNDINGIGKKTAKDIIKVFPNEEKLKEAISHDDELPFRDDIEEKLRRKYGRR